MQDDNETGYWWLRVVATLHSIVGVIRLVLAVLGVVVGAYAATRSDLYGALAPSILLSAGGIAFAGVIIIGLGQAHKALADIADNTHYLPLILRQLRGAAPAVEPDLVPIETPDFGLTGTHRSCPKCGSIVFAAKPVCSECGTRVCFSRPA